VPLQKKNMRTAAEWMTLSVGGGKYGNK
jgi:hypothetical protein